MQLQHLRSLLPQPLRTKLLKVIVLASAGMVTPATTSALQATSATLLTLVAKIHGRSGRDRDREIAVSSEGATMATVTDFGVIEARAEKVVVAKGCGLIDTLAQAAVEAADRDKRISGLAESRRPVGAEKARAGRGLMKNVGAADRVVKKWAAAEVRGAIMEAKEAVVTGSDRGVKKGAAVVVADSDTGVKKGAAVVSDKGAIKSVVAAERSRSS